MKVSRAHIHPHASATYEHTVEHLREGGHLAACAAVCRRLAAVLDAELVAAQAAGAGVACAAGCSFCCHLRVTVFPHEALALLSHIRARLPASESAAFERRIVETARRIEAMTVDQHYAARVPCAFLVDGRCAAYEVRPSACAAHHSLSRQRCEHAFDHPEHHGTAKNNRPALLELQVLGDALIAATHSALAALGRPTERVELHQALRSLIEADPP
jgi:Fe-S-cluster containining protein